MFTSITKCNQAQILQSMQEVSKANGYPVYFISQEQMVKERGKLGNKSAYMEG